MKRLEERFLRTLLEVPARGLWGPDQSVLWPGFVLPPTLHSPSHPWRPPSENMTHQARGTQFQPCPAPSPRDLHLLLTPRSRCTWVISTGENGAWDRGALSDSLPCRWPKARTGSWGSQVRDLRGPSTPSLGSQVPATPRRPRVSGTSPHHPRSPAAAESSAIRL